MPEHTRGNKEPSMTAKATLIHGSDYRLYAYLAPVVSPVGGYALTITSQRLASRNPNEEQTRFFSCLEREGLHALADLIQQELQARGATA
jgi:hypothetical protein